MSRIFSLDPQDHVYQTQSITGKRNQFIQLKKNHALVKTQVIGKYRDGLIVYYRNGGPGNFKLGLEQINFKFIQIRVQYFDYSKISLKNNQLKTFY